MRDNFNYGGGRGIRTPARFDPPVGFQDRSLQPNLGIPPFQTSNNISCGKFKVNIIPSNFLPGIILFSPAYYAHGGI